MWSCRDAQLQKHTWRTINSGSADGLSGYAENGKFRLYALGSICPFTLYIIIELFVIPLLNARTKPWRCWAIAQQRSSYTDVHKDINASWSLSYGHRIRDLQSISDTRQLAKLFPKSGGGVGITCCCFDVMQTFYYTRGSMVTDKHKKQRETRRCNGDDTEWEGSWTRLIFIDPPAIHAGLCCCCTGDTLNLETWGKTRLNAQYAQTAGVRYKPHKNGYTYYDWKIRGEYWPFYSLLLPFTFSNYICMVNGGRDTNIAGCGTIVSRLFLSFSEKHGASFNLLHELASGWYTADKSRKWKNLHREASFLSNSVTSCTVLHSFGIHYSHLIHTTREPMFVTASTHTELHGLGLYLPDYRPVSLLTIGVVGLRAHSAIVDRETSNGELRVGLLLWIAQGTKMWKIQRTRKREGESDMLGIMNMNREQRCNGTTAAAVRGLLLFQMTSRRTTAAAVRGLLLFQATSRLCVTLSSMYYAWVQNYHF